MALCVYFHEAAHIAKLKRYGAKYVTYWKRGSFNVQFEDESITLTQKYDVYFAALVVGTFPIIVLSFFTNFLVISAVALWYFVISRHDIKKLTEIAEKGPQMPSYITALQVIIAIAVMVVIAIISSYFTVRVPIETLNNTIVVIQ